jgi:hypothetical protein
MQINWLHIYQGETEPQYSVNLAFVTDVNREDPDSWEITTLGGNGYTLEGADLQQFRTLAGL